jgi:sugar phosphate isomerase/epimerase
VTGILPIALQLYTVRDQTERDFTGTLERVAEIGYPGVEFAGYGGLEARQLHDLLVRLGLAAAGAHVSLAALEADAAREIEYCLAIGCHYLVVPWLPLERRDPAGAPALAGFLDRLGRQCQEAGLGLAYHNHSFEFETVDGEVMLDGLLKATDPKLVALELDIYWALYAGMDPLTYMQRNADRVRLLHLKDMRPDREATEVGEGIIDMVGIARAAERQGVKWLIVEHDEPTMPSLESARASFENMKRLGLASTSRVR